LHVLPRLAFNVFWLLKGESIETSSLGLNHPVERFPPHWIARMVFDRHGTAPMHWT